MMAAARWLQNISECICASRPEIGKPLITQTNMQIIFYCKQEIENRWLFFTNHCPFLSEPIDVDWTVINYKYSKNKYQLIYRERTL